MIYKISVSNEREEDNLFHLTIFGANKQVIQTIKLDTKNKCHAYKNGILKGVELAVSHITSECWRLPR